eukprot:scaffold10220_cov36-Tisochrysis_lutea.AAC.2
MRGATADGNAGKGEKNTSAQRCVMRIACLEAASESTLAHPLGGAACASLRNMRACGRRLSQRGRKVDER